MWLILSNLKAMYVIKEVGFDFGGFILGIVKGFWIPNFNSG